MAGDEVLLLTGATGFVGKVLLQQLMARERPPERVFALIRPQAGRSADARFRRDVARAACFEGLAPGWTGRVTPVEGDLAQPGCGLAPEWRERLEREVTHVLHAAASVDFDLPLAEAVAANTTSALHVLELARGFERLEHMVAVSTAYVTPHPGEGVPVEERLAPLPDPEALYEDVRAGTANERALLDATGHPNTYTLTKSLAEHLLVARRGRVPLSIARPSIISASLREPFPGWIDSNAAFAGVVALLGLGHLRALVGDLDARLDLVPVDWVAKRLLEIAAAPPRDGVALHHLTAGAARSPSLRDCRTRILDWFRAHPVERIPVAPWVGPDGGRFQLIDRLRHRLPVRAAMLVSPRARRNGDMLLGRLDQLNVVFPYFTQRSFDFRTRGPALGPDFDPLDYVTEVCRGVHRHLLRQDETALAVAGRAHPGYGGDLRWAATQPRGGPLTRGVGWLLAKALRRFAGVVSLDRPSFERALAAASDDAVLVLAPSHRSYLDFVLCSYLCFARPELGIELPRVAAASEFARIPGLGRMLEALGAFYLERGRGVEDKRLTRQVDRLVRERRALEFFVEGGRSRSRRILDPKRGLLRSLQATGARCALLPIAITYDRVPEEHSFASELAGGPRPPMRLRGLLHWTARMMLGRIDVGRVHVACGEPLVLGLESDVHALSRELVARHQRATVTTRFQIEAFLAACDAPGIDAAWLERALRRRGARVLPSPLAGTALDARVAACLRYGFEHWFYPEADAAFPTHPVVQAHLEANDRGAFRGRAPHDPPTDPEIVELLRLLFEPVCRDWQRVATRLVALRAEEPLPTPPEIAAAHDDAHLPSVEAAFAHLVGAGVLAAPGDGSDRLRWGARRDELARVAEGFAWKEPARD